MRSAAVLAAMAVIACARADEYDDLIARFMVSWDRNSVEKLYKGPFAVDQKILKILRVVADDPKKRDNRGVANLVDILTHRYGSSFNLADPNRRLYNTQDFRGVRILMRLHTRYNLNSGYYFSEHGPAFYTFLLSVAKSRRPERSVALGILETTAQSGRRKGRPGDPALIRLFRREGNAYALAALRDRQSIPLIRAKLSERDPAKLYMTIQAIEMMGDSGATPLLLPLLGEKWDMECGPSKSIGPATWTLRRVALPNQANLILEYAKTHEGYPRAFAINVLGYVGSNAHVVSLKRFANDPVPRVWAAARNAILRIQGKLPK